MRVVKDLCGTTPPAPFDFYFNTENSADGTGARYKGSLCTLQDWEDADGLQATNALETTAFENIFGILEEDVAAGTTYRMNVAAATGTPVRKKIQPVLPSTVLEAEYVQTDVAGTAATDTGFTIAAGSTTVVAPSSGVNFCNNGGWLYFLTGSNADYLHYVRTNDNTTGATLRTAVVNAVASTDTCLVIQPSGTYSLDLDSQAVDIKSEWVIASRHAVFQGIDHFISAPGVAKTKLNIASHDGLKIANARFFHQFTIPGGASLPNVWVNGVKPS
ncbi:MAG: hypothetical protein KKD01_19490 [Proteobacteria bacterium]|nr:hypothetical protein [Pseudomonadota bacterium]